MKVVTRFAPSPTGVLHTGSARTALFNYLFAKHHNGKFMLRIEDTDQERSKPEYVKAITDNLNWLGLSWDGDIFYQLQQSKRHTEIAKELVQLDKAYYCYATTEEIEAFRQKFPHQKFVSPWRDNKSQGTDDRKPVVRLKVEHTGSTTINDIIMGEITIHNDELDDMILLRSDGVPTYMLAVVVDDHDMEITHVIRGDDHLTNAFRQRQIYDAMGWNIPKFAHIPLIHDKDGRKLSKRQGAMGILEYSEQGYLSDAVINHLLRLGWSHGDQEIFSLKEAIKLFNLENVGKSPARFDNDKLNFINSHYIKILSNNELMKLLKPFLAKDLSANLLERILKGMDSLKLRSSNLMDLAESSQIYISKKLKIDDKSKEILKTIDSNLVDEIKTIIINSNQFERESLHHSFEEFAKVKGLKFPYIMQSLRALILGTFNAPGIFEVMEILGNYECLERINKINL